MSGERRWPETLCSPLDSGRPPKLARPVRVGGHLLCTDGNVCVEIADDGREAQEAWGGMDTAMSRHMGDEQPGMATFEAATLREFCGPAEGPCPHCTEEERTRTCGRCGDTGWIECECTTCGEGHDRVCPDCEDWSDCLRCGNEGHVDRYTIDRLASFLGVLFNPRLMAALLDGAPGQTVTIARQGGEMRPLIIRGDGWRAVLMPVRASDTGLHVEPIDHLALESVR